MNSSYFNTKSSVKTECIGKYIYNYYYFIIRPVTSGHRSIGCYNVIQCKSVAKHRYLLITVQ